MPWNPDLYNQFKNIRYQPFFDLMNLISPKNLHKAIDIGCGTGEQTKILSEKFPDARFFGIDSSAEMLHKSLEFKGKNLDFKQKTIEELYDSDEKHDLIFSNAALQWSDDHHKLFPKIISLVNENGQFAVQMPVQNENVLNQILTQLASEEPFKTQLKGFNRISPVLSLDEYAKIMFEGGLKDLNISVKVYPIIVDDAERLFDFISGSALIPYMERLSGSDAKVFVEEFKTRIRNKFEDFPAIYAFKRILLYGRK